MTSGTKILLALIGLFVGILVLYYGFLMPSPPPGGGLVRDPVLEKPPAVVSATQGKGSRAGDAPGRPGSALASAPPVTPVPKQTARQVKPLAAAETGTIERGTGPANPLAVTMGEAAGVSGALGGATRRPAPSRLDAAGGIPQRESAATDRTASPTSAAAAPPADAAASAYGRHVVKEGDTLTSIAQHWFGDHRKWDLIAQANEVDPNRLKPGQVLQLPPRDAARTTGPIPVATPGPTSDRRAERTQAATHTVRAGDSLSSIAQARYGDRSRWKSIYAANRDRIGPDPDALVVGMTLRIP